MFDFTLAFDYEISNRYGRIQMEIGATCLTVDFQTLLLRKNIDFAEELRRLGEVRVKSSA